MELPAENLPVEIISPAESLPVFRKTFGMIGLFVGGDDPRLAE